MNKSKALRILAQNLHSYNAINREFSQTRQRIWPALMEIKKYIRPQMKVLDLGCGNGRLLELFDGLDITYHGIDSSCELIKEAKKKFRFQIPNLKFITANILSLDISEASYDMIACVAVIHHIPSREFRWQALKNIYAVLKPGGLIFMTNWNMWQWRSKKSVWKCEKWGGFRDCKTYWTLNNKRYPLYYYAFTKFELQRMFKKIGFIILRSEYYKNNIITVAKK